MRDRLNKPSPYSLITYFIILAAGIGSLFVNAPSNYAAYIFGLLLYIWIMQVRTGWVPQRLRTIILLVETAAAAALYHSYGGLLFSLFGAMLLSSYNHPVPARFMLILLQAGLMNWISLNLFPEWIGPSNLFYFTLAGLLYYMHHSTEEKQEIQKVYDQLRKKHYELEEARAHLIRYAQQVEQLAQLEERNRISRDLHDNLGHQLIRVKMMMDAIIEITPSQPAKALKMVEQVRDQLASSMDNLRSTVRRIKPSSQNQHYSLPKLIEDFALTCGVKVEFQLLGLPHSLLPSEEYILYRNAQEAMTNAVRHGKATQVWITLEIENDQIKFLVRNNGSLSDLSPQRGLGLEGMEERVQWVGGSIEVQCAEQFSVLTLLPRRQTS
jgi:two-component system NarL family sensor kinase